MSEENEEAGSDEALENINSDVSPSGSVDGGESPARSMGSDANPNINVGAPKSTSQRCGRFIGRVCNSISNGVSNLFGWSRGPGTRNVRLEQQDFRAPVELNFGGTE